MKCFSFSKRNIKELIRDPLTIVFGIAFPVVLLGLLTLIQSHIPAELFIIDKLAPGMTVFALSFFSLFSGLLLAKDRTDAFLIRLYSSPMRPTDFILGYILPFIPLGLLQSAICYLFSAILGLKLSVNVLLAVIVNLPVCIMFISIGLLAGSCLNDKQVGGITGALLTNLSAWLSGIWFDLSLMGDALKKVAYALPFANAVDAAKAAYAGDFSAVISPLLIVLGYTLVLTALSVIIFKAKTKNN